MTEDPDNKGRVAEDFIDYNQAPRESQSESPAPREYEIPGNEEMIRTQLYLTAKHREYLTEQATITGKSMAAQIRELIEQQMKPQMTAWDLNPLLDEPASDPTFEGGTNDSASSNQGIYGSYEG